jgi:hypothetical protein
VLFIGRRVWPYPRRLVVVSGPSARGGRGDASSPPPGDRRLLERALFVDPKDDGARLWAIDLALRCRAIAAVVADGSGLSMASSRRLQLAAEAGSALALLARPPNDLPRPSAAGLRLLVTRDAVATSSPSAPRPRWVVTLLRAKGVQNASGTQSPSAVCEPVTLRGGAAIGPCAPPCFSHCFPLEGDPVHGVVEGAVALPSHLVDGSRAPEEPARAPRRRARAVPRERVQAEE